VEGAELLEDGVVRVGSLGGAELSLALVLLPTAVAEGVVERLLALAPPSVSEGLNPPLLPPDLDVLAERGRENVVNLGTGTTAS